MRQEYKYRAAAGGAKTAGKIGFAGGIVQFVEHINRSKQKLHEKVIYFNQEKNGLGVELAMQWNDSYAETITSYVNNINTLEGGTHVSGFRTALTRAVNRYISTSPLAKNLKESLLGDDIREGLAWSGGM